jgi:hypothetical protein
MSWERDHKNYYLEDSFDWVEPLNNAMECLIDVLSYIDRFDENSHISSLFAPFNKGKYNKNISKAVKSYVTEANKLIVSLLSFHPGVCGHKTTKAGWRDEKECRKQDKQSDRLKKSSPGVPGLYLTICSLREIGTLLTLLAKVLNHLKITE